MKPACSDATGSNRNTLNAQAGNDQKVRPDPGAGKGRSTQQPVPTVNVDNDRQTIGLPAQFFPPQHELTSQFFAGTPPGQLTASQPVLRGPEAAGSAHGSGKGQMDAPGSLALQEPGPTSCEQASRVAGKPSLEQGSESGRIQATLDKRYRSKLSAWVESADLFGRARPQKAEKRIIAYLEEPAEQRELIDLYDLGLSALPPLPAGLIALRVGSNKLSALPEHLPQTLRVLCAYDNKLTALPEHLPQGLQKLDVKGNKLIALPEHLPNGLQKLEVSRNQLIALPERLPQGLQELYVSDNRLTALPKRLPQGLQELYVSDNRLTALPKHLPQGLRELNVRNNKLTALPEHLPQGLHKLNGSCNALTALPEHLPQGLQQIYVRQNKLTTLPEHLPRGLKELIVGSNKLTTLPEHLPQSLENLSVSNTLLDAKTLLALMRSNTSITELGVDWLDIDAGSEQELDAELVNNMEHPARLIKAAVTLDLLTRFGLTRSDQTGALIKRDSSPNPDAGRLSGQPIPFELHDVLAANCPKDVLAVLAGMVDGTAQ